VERGERAVNGYLRGVDVEPPEFDRLVGLDHDLVAEFDDAAEFGVAPYRIAVADERHVPLAELRDGVVVLAGPESPPRVVDLRLRDRLQVDQRAVVRGALRRCLLPQLPVLGVGLAALLFEGDVEAVEVVALLVRNGRPD